METSDSKEPQTPTAQIRNQLRVTRTARELHEAPFLPDLESNDERAIREVMEQQDLLQQENKKPEEPTK